MLKLMGIVVMLALTVVGARSCDGSSSSANSPLDPANLARNGIAGVCAEQAAVAADGSAAGSSGGSAGGSAISSGEMSALESSNPAGMRALSQALGGNFSCPTTTISAGSGG